jgi:hypothetical protein
MYMLQNGGSSSTREGSKLCYDQSASLSWCQAFIWAQDHRYLLLSDSCGFVRMRRLLWWEDVPVVYNCWWSSPAQSYLSSMKTSSHFASWVWMKFLWWLLLCLLLTRSHWSRWFSRWELHGCTVQQELQRSEIRTKFLLENLRKKDNLGQLRIDDRITFRCILLKWNL